MSIEQHIKNGFVSILRGASNHAMQEFDAALEIDHNSEYAYFGKGEVCRENGQLQQALAMYQKSIDLRPDNPKAVALKASILKQFGRNDDAKAEFDKAVAATLLDQYDHISLGVMHLTFGNPAKAFEEYNKTITKDKGFTLGHIMIGNLYEGQQYISGQRDTVFRALECYDNAIKNDNNCAVAHLNKSRTFLSINDLDSALNSLNEAIKVNKQFALAHFQRGEILVIKNNFRPALDSYEHAIQANKMMVDAYLRKSDVFIRQNKPTDAIEPLDRLLQEIPNFFEAYMLKIDLLEHLRRHTDIIDCCDSIIEKAPNFIPAYQKKVATLLQLGKKQEAEECNMQLLKKLNLEFGLYDVGRRCEALGRKEEAMAAYDKALEVKSDFVPALIQKGIIFIENGSFDKAIEFCQKALAIDPKSWAALNNLGLSQAALKKYAEAIKSYNKAVEFNANNHIVWCNLGNAYLALEEKEEAIKCYDKSLELNPRYTEATISRLKALLDLKSYDVSKSTNHSTNISEGDPIDSALSRGLSVESSEPPDYTTSQMQQGLTNITSMNLKNVEMKDIASLHAKQKADISSYNTLLSLCIEKIKANNNCTISVVEDLFQILEHDQNWPSIVVELIAKSIAEVTRTVPEYKESIIKLATTRLSEGEELIRDYMFQILEAIMEIPGNLQLVKSSAMSLMESSDDNILLMAAKLVRKATTESRAKSKDIESQTGRAEYKFEITVYKDELDTFKSALENSREDDFIQDYIKAHMSDGVISDDIVYSLLINTAISFKEYDLLRSTLEKKAGAYNILTYVAVHGYSPISTALHSGDPKILEIIGAYLKKAGNEVYKSTISSEDLENLKDVLYHLPNDLVERKDILSGYLKPLYLESDLKPLGELIDELDGD